MQISYFLSICSIRIFILNISSFDLPWHFDDLDRKKKWSRFSTQLQLPGIHQKSTGHLRQAGTQAQYWKSVCTPAIASAR
jgi:hypothetical protein